MTGRTRRPEQAALEALRERLVDLRELLPTLTRHAARRTVAELLEIMGEIEEARADLDPIKDPGESFDPADPDTAGQLVALALIAQDKVPLGGIAPAYGSGVYAIYYTGHHHAYTAISSTETPIYVGKADPARADARTAREQGPRLYGRLKDHRKSIRTVSEYALAHGLPNPLKLDDFVCRRLVCATNAQLVAERHLIALFKPVWNSEIRICWGISKHGDSADTRSNKRSPWDVMHPGRSWAMADSLVDQSTVAEITQGIAGHLVANPPFRDRVRLVDGFLSTFAQHAPVVASMTVEGDSVEE